LGVIYAIISACFFALNNLTSKLVIKNTPLNAI